MKNKVQDEDKKIKAILLKIFLTIIFLSVMIASIPLINEIFNESEEKSEVNAYMDALFIKSHFDNYKNTSKDIFYSLDVMKLLIDRELDDDYLKMIRASKDDIVFTQSNDGKLTMKEVEEQISMVLKKYHKSYTSYEKMKKESLVNSSIKQ